MVWEDRGYQVRGVARRSGGYPVTTDLDENVDFTYDIKNSQLSVNGEYIPNACRHFWDLTPNKDLPRDLMQLGGEVIADFSVQEIKGKYNVAILKATIVEFNAFVSTEREEMFEVEVTKSQLEKLKKVKGKIRLTLRRVWVQKSQIAMKLYRIEEGI